MDTDNRPVMVTVRTITYNHEPYLRDCLNGIVMQKTNFRFEAVVHDDCSTDHTADIIREYAAKYPDIIKPIYETENQYSKGKDSLMGKKMDALTHGKYIAICEGDDYWTDPNKLQMQVDFLEAHPDYGLVHTGSKRYIQKEKVFREGFAADTDFNRLLNANTINTLTVMYRRELFVDYIIDIPDRSGWLMGDYPLWLYISHKSKIEFMPQITGVYRVLENSASHPTDFRKNYAFGKSFYEIGELFAKKYGNAELVHMVINNRINSLNNIAFGFNKGIGWVEFKLICKHRGFSFKQYVITFLAATTIGVKIVNLIHGIKTHNR